MAEQTDRWVTTSDVIPMFPTLVWQIQLEPHLCEAINTQILAVLSRLRQGLPALARGQGWQSIQTLHTLPEFRDFVSCVHRAVMGIVRFLRIDYDALEITACWATVLSPGADHRTHYHPNNY